MMIYKYFLFYKLIQMSQTGVSAISNEEVECGKRVSDSKKKFIWKFKIGDQLYNLSLVSSALSGKRKVYLDDVEIYSEKNMLNYKFDFNHNIEGHNIRIFKEGESINKYDVRIDNRSFAYLLKKTSTNATGEKKQGKKVSQFAAKEEDPFSEFAKVSTGSPQKSSSLKDQFGDFDDFDFSKPSGEAPQVKKSTSQKQKQIDFFDFGQGKKEEPKKDEPLIQQQNFETGNINNFEKNLQQATKEDLLSSDFATNVYRANNNYLDLLDSKADSSNTWGQQKAPKTWKDELKCDMSKKQMANRTKMTAEMLFDSLI